MILSEKKKRKSPYFLHRILSEEKSKELINGIENNVPYTDLEMTFHITGLSKYVRDWNKGNPDRQIIRNKNDVKTGRNNHQTYFLSNYVSKEVSDEIIRKLFIGEQTSVEISSYYNIPNLQTKVTVWNNTHAVKDPEKYILCNYTKNQSLRTYNGYDKDRIIKMIESGVFETFKECADFFKCCDPTIREFVKRNIPHMYESLKR